MTNTNTTTETKPSARNTVAKPARRGASGKNPAKKAPAKGKRRDTARPSAKPGVKGAHTAADRIARAGEGSKKARVLALMKRPGGATLAEIRKATGWQPHTVRGFISGTLVKKMGLKVESVRNAAKERNYRLAD